MPKKASQSVEGQINELRKVAAQRLILVVLDGICVLRALILLSGSASPLHVSFFSDMWDAEHERPFSCIDPATASKLLVVCKMRGDSGRFLLLRSLLFFRPLASRASCRKG